MIILPLTPNTNQSLQFDIYTIRISIGTRGQVFVDVKDNQDNIILNTIQPASYSPMRLGGNTLFIYDSHGVGESPKATGLGERWLLIYA